MSKKAPPKQLASEGIDFEGDIFLAQLAAREEPNRDGRMTTIIFIRHKNTRGQEISGYIDFVSAGVHRFTNARTSMRYTSLSLSLAVSLAVVDVVRNIRIRAAQHIRRCPPTHETAELI